MGARNRQRPSWIRGRDAIKILNGLYPRSPRTPQSSSMIRGAAKASWKLDENCRWSYERNVGAEFYLADVGSLDSNDLSDLFGRREPRLVAGCAPCQPFSSYGRTRRGHDDRWRLLDALSGAVRASTPEFVTMENVPGLERHGIFRKFVRALRSEGYSAEWGVLECARYGIPQRRRRLVLVASRVGRARLPEPTHVDPVDVAHAIGHLPPPSRRGRIRGKVPTRYMWRRGFLR